MDLAVVMIAVSNSKKVFSLRVNCSMAIVLSILIMDGALY